MTGQHICASAFPWILMEPMPLPRTRNITEDGWPYVQMHQSALYISLVFARLGEGFIPSKGLSGGTSQREGAEILHRRPCLGVMKSGSSCSA